MTGPHEQLVAAIEAALDACGEPNEVQPGVYAGDNLAERLSAALQEVAERRGGTEALVAHRPGCWEAQHVAALGWVWR
jgi:hypothetical protein